MHRLVDIIADTLPDNHPWKGNVYGLVEKLVERGVTIQQWISVKDRLPEAGQEVLILERFEDEPRHIISVSTYDSKVFDDIWANVTHWMPIPEPPKIE